MIIIHSHLIFSVKKILNKHKYTRPDIPEIPHAPNEYHNQPPEEPLNNPLPILNPLLPDTIDPVPADSYEHTTLHDVNVQQPTSPNQSEDLGSNQDPSDSDPQDLPSSNPEQEENFYCDFYPGGQTVMYMERLSDRYLLMIAYEKMGQCFIIPFLLFLVVICPWFSDKNGSIFTGTLAYSCVFIINFKFLANVIFRRS